jgi:protein SCO1/2
MTNASNADSVDKQQNRKRKRFFPVLIFVGFLLGLLLGWFVIQLSSDSGRSEETPYHGSIIESPTLAADFTLSSHPGERVSLSDFDEQVVLLYFGYTYCPDVCPASMAQLAKVTSELTNEEKRQVQVAMITVDPTRDTEELMADYMGHFDPSFLGLSGTEEEIASVTKDYGVYYEKQEGGTETDYLVNHTASVFAIDKAGYLRLLYPFGTPGEDIASDLRLLISES